ncbi:MAG: hypothetical protein ABWY13_13565 [Mesorhizobium sp.]|jgi:uncharacterized protein YjiS (DUF1127 family)|nr:hypothetical protein [Mesorhizobium sp.]
MINELFRGAKSRLAKRRQYNQLVEEIHAMTNRDFLDIGVGRSEMLRQAYLDVYGRG